MGRYAPPGYLLYVHEGSLVARRFDLRTLESGGEEIVVAERLGVDNSQNFRNAGFSIANGASLVFGNDSEVVRLQWLDRAGTPAGSNGPTDLYWSQELSPDGTRVALEILDETGQADIWTLDLVRDTRQRLTRTPGVFEYSPRWSPDGLHIAYSSTGPADTASIRQRLADGSAGEEVVAEQTPRLKFVSDWWHDGRAILVRALSDPGRSDGRLVSLATSKDRQAPLAPLPADQLVADARFSPNGDWIAYVSNQTGQDEVYIQLVAGGRPTPVSTAGGEFPSWRGDGEELFYVAPGNILTAVTVKWRGDIALGLPKGLFRLPSLSADVLGRSAGRRSPYTTRDGLRFLVRMRPQETSPPLTWVLNWTARMPR
jgi:Tol biopolymer transport system component